MSEMGGMKPPGNFNPVGLEVATSWQKWSEQFDFYMKATEKDTKGQRCPGCYFADFVGRRSHGHLSFV